MDIPDEQFVAEIEQTWRLRHVIDASYFPRLLAIAGKCQSVGRIEDENAWLRGRIDALTSTTTMP